MENVLEHERGRKADDDPAIEHAVGQHLRRCVQEKGHRLHERDAEHGEQNADDHGKEDHHGKIAVCLLRLTLAKHLGNKRGAAGADHEADSAEHHDERHD